MGMIEEALRLISRNRHRERAAEGRLDDVDLAHLIEVAVRVLPNTFSADRELLLVDSEGHEVTVPIGVAEEAGVLAAVQELPGFNLQKYTLALTAEVDELVICWRA